MDALVIELYARVLQTANEFLHKCMHSSFSISKLAERKPTYAEMAKDCLLLADVIARLSDDDPMRKQQVFEYCELMVRIGNAIQGVNEVELRRAVEELNAKPFALN